MIDSRADGHDDAGDAVAWNRRQSWQHRDVRSAPPSDLRLDEGHAGERDVDERFAGTAYRVRGIPQNEHLGRAEFLHHDRLHV